MSRCRNGYSLRLRGLDPGINDHAYDRGIVLHGAPYVSEANATRFGRLGRSWGCAAVRPTLARRLIDTVKGGTVLFAYGTPAGRSPDVWTLPSTPAVDPPVSICLRVGVRDPAAHRDTREGDD